MGVRSIRGVDGAVYAVGDGSGCEDLYTTLVVTSNSGWEVRGFTYGMGDRIAGADRLYATRNETNMPPGGWRTPAVWLGLEWGIPLFAPARFQKEPALGDYAVTPSDIAEFVGKAQIELYDGKWDKPFVSYPAVAADVRRSELRVSQQLAFQRPLEHRPDDKLFATLRWPTVYPVFGKHSTSSEPGTLIVTFKLLGRLPMGDEPVPPREVIAAPSLSAGEAGVMRETRDLLREQYRIIVELLNRTLAQQQEIRTQVDAVKAAQEDIRLDTNWPNTEPEIDEKRFRRLEGDKK